MSLTLPPAYSNTSKLGNIQENWFAQLFHEDSYLSFDGTNDYVDLGATTSSSAIAIGSDTGITIAFWINFPTLGVAEPIFRSHDHASNYVGYAIDKNSSNQIVFNWYDGGGSTSDDRKTMTGDTALSADTWYFVIITSTFAQATSGTKIYINGTTSDSITASGDYSGTYPVYTGSSLRGIIGQKLPSTDIWGEFKLKNLGIWAGVLDGANLTVIYNSGNFLSFLEDSGNYDQSSALKGYWETNNGEIIVPDKTGNGADGTLSGAVYGDFLPISLTDTTVDSIFYHGVITNKPSVRTSIDLANSTAKTGNISLSIVNFNYKGDDFSAELFLGTRKYINRNVKIYSQLNGDSTFTNCLQIYQGRLISVSHDDASISLQITEQRPWDFISIPNTKSTTNNVYFPVVYGDFTPETSTDASPQFCESAIVHPVPQDTIIGNNIKFLPHADTETDGSDSDSRIHYYEPNYNIFVPLDPPDDTADSYGGGGAVNAPITLLREFKTQDYDIASTTTLDNPENLKDATSYATAQLQVVNGSSNVVLADDDYIYLDFKKPDGKVTNLNITFDYIVYRISANLSSSPVTKYIKFIDESDGNNDDLEEFTLTAGGNSTIATGSTNANLANPNSIGQIKLHLKMRLSDTNVGFNDANYTISVRNIVLTVKCQLDRDGEPDAVAKKLADIKQLYSGTDGHNESYSGHFVQYGHEAHRDIIIRYTGYTTTAPANWSALDTDRAITNWKIRWWELEPVDLKKALEKLQYEFGFIFKFRADGTGAMIYIIQTSEMQTIADSGSPYPIFNNSDINNLSISNSSLSDLLTKMEINYEKHPANKSYLSSVTSSNTTTRSNYNIQAKENIKEVNLDMNVGTPNTSGQTDGNADFYSYYDNIFGDIKKIISCDIVNSAKGYSLETGDIVQFSSTAGEMPVEPFGDNWADFYMITDLNRSLGKVSITAREVG